ncbi:MAG TPA: hypothetical protein VFD53_06255 [Ilumatobacter sp.]|nr:hypothetical protein [Ilumatobacter sp.]
MPTFQDDPVHGKAEGTPIIGESVGWHGVFGTTASTTGGHGVAGDGPVGVSGVGRTWIGVYGETHAAPESGAAGVWGDGKQTGDGVKGVAHGAGKAAVCGFHEGVAGDGMFWGVFGQSRSGRGVHGEGQVGVAGIGQSWIGVYGETHGRPESGSAGVWGDGLMTGDGVKSVAKGQGKAAVCGFQLGNNGPGVFGQGAPAGFFEGDVTVTGKLSVRVDVELLNGDCAEEFRVADHETVEPGTVMVLGDDEVLLRCSEAYDRRVAGVVSGAGHYRPAIVLDAQGDVDRRPVAVVGKVYCKVDAGYGAIGVGDLLTTSATPGHAMKASDAARAFGSVIGKALRPLTSGQDLIPILVALQ